jgi:hypothetical protein
MMQSEDEPNGGAQSAAQTSANSEFVELRFNSSTAKFSVKEMAPSLNSVDDVWKYRYLICYFLLLFSLVKRAIQYWLDKSTIHVVPRWIGFGVLLLLFFLRIYFVQGYFIVAYGLGIFLLNNFIAFLSPLEDPLNDGPSLPSTDQEAKEYRPFTRRLPEFKFWLACARGTLTSIFMTFFSVFDIPVFWPILLLYFFVLFFMTMKRQIMHMYKHKYIPISFGKAKYKNAGSETGMYGGGMSKAR